MAEAPAYTTVPGKLPDLLKKIREAGVPSRANVAWLTSMGFKSSNDRSMINVLRQIGFVEASGAPTPAWREYRGSDYKAVLGRAIQLGYQDLYATYSDAHARQNTDLSHVFSTKTAAGKQAIDKMVSTFKTLAAQADFGSITTATTPVDQSPESPNGEGPSTVVSRVTTSGAGMTVNINVELTLPATTDESVYVAFFTAMRKHLLTDSS
jgi:hypothetical protein